MAFLLIAATPANEAAGFFFSGALGIFLFILSIVWILFPFFVIGRLGALIKLQRAAQQHTESSALHTARHLEALCKLQKAANEAATERNKALQWIIDSWPPQR
jgi:hypothetical protein